MSATTVKAKGKCCKDSPRCKRCPVVCKRLENAGLMERIGPRKWEATGTVPKKKMKAARGR